VSCCFEVYVTVVSCRFEVYVTVVSCFEVYVTVVSCCRFLMYRLPQVPASGSILFHVELVHFYDAERLAINSLKIWPAVDSNCRRIIACALSTPGFLSARRLFFLLAFNLPAIL